MSWVPAKSAVESGGSFLSTFPYKIFLKKETTGTTNIYSFAVAYHSELLKNTFTDNTTYLSFQKQVIDPSTLDNYIIIPDPTAKNVYITLDMKVSNLTVTSAKINFYVEGSSGLAPFSFGENYNQTDAQVILGIIVNDAESQAGTTGGGDNQTTYVVQKVFTDLIIANLIINSVPVITAVPFTGGPIN